MQRNEALDTAKHLINGDRQDEYGDASESFDRIAAMFSAYLGTEVNGRDIAALLILMKVSRLTTSTKDDNWVDIIGYAALGAEREGASS